MLEIDIWVFQLRKMIVGHHLGRPKKKFLEKIVFAGPHLYIIYYVHTRGGPSPTRYEIQD